jgi:prefoldin subunit 5
MTSKQQVTTHDEMLSGWKDIANYMGKGVRTVQRYERDLGLPVRRVSGNPSGAVVATKSDLDSWVRSSATAQESLNRSQKALNVAQESRNITQDLRNVSQDSRNVSQDAFNRDSRRGRTRLREQVGELRRELSRLRQQVKEMRQRQDVMASAIKDYSKARASLHVSGKHQKRN